jgi:hypothetical protein
MEDLSELATKNIPRLDSAFQAFLNARSPSDVDAIIAFSDWVRDVCRLTINAKIYVICDLLKNGTYKNVYDAAAEYSSLLSIDRDDLLRAWLGAYYDRRVVFDRAFKEGHKFIYAALTSGNGGVREYDPYCLQLIESFHATVSTLAYLPGDSLSICLTTTGEFDSAKTSEMLAPHSHRHVLAACHRGSDAASIPRANWPNILNEKASYIEAIFVGNVTLAQVEKLQVLQSEYERIMSLILRTIGRKLETAEHTLVDSFRQILTASRDGLISLEHVS